MSGKEKRRVCVRACVPSRARARVRKPEKENEKYGMKEEGIGPRD